MINSSVVNYSNYSNKHRISGEFNKRCGAYSRKYGTKRYYYHGFKRRPQISAAFLEKKLVSFGTFPYALCNLMLTNKLLVK